MVRWMKNTVCTFLLKHLPRKESFFILLLFSLSLYPVKIYALCGLGAAGGSWVEVCKTKKEAISWGTEKAPNCTMTCSESSTGFGGCAWTILQNGQTMPCTVAMYGCDPIDPCCNNPSKTYIRGGILYCCPGTSNPCCGKRVNDRCCTKPDDPCCTRWLGTGNGGASGSGGGGDGN